MTWWWITVVAILGMIFPVDAQERPDLAVAQGFSADVVALTGARIVTAPGAVIEAGVILIERGRITAVGADVVIPPVATRIDLSGLTVYPGFVDMGASGLIDPDVKLPIVEQRSVDAAREALARLPIDLHHGLTPHFQATSAVRTKAESLDAYRRGGICLVHVVPTGRIASGWSGLVQLSGLPPREAVVLPELMGALRIWERGGSEYPSTMMGVFAHLRQKFLDAEWSTAQQALFDKNVAGVERPAHDPVWAALHQLRAGQRPTFFQVETRDDVERALRFSTEQSLKPVLWGVRDPQVDPGLLKQRSVPVVLRLDHGDEPAAPKSSGDDEYVRLADPPGVLEWKQQKWRERVGLAKTLQAAGVPISFSTEGLKSPDELLSGVRRTIQQGLSVDAALAALTTQPAALLGVESTQGTIAAGKLAHLTVLTGPLEHSEARVRYVFIAGQRFGYHRDAKPVAPSSATPEAPAADLAGTWDVKIETGGPPFPAQFELQQTGQAYSGRFASGQGNGLLTRSAVRGRDVELEVSIGAGDAAVLLKFTAQLQGEELTGTLKSPFAPASPFTARRRPENPATANPVELQLETSGDDPVADAPVSALEALSPGKSVWPLEFAEQRTARPAATGGNLFIRGGMVITGTGAPPLAASILVKEGRIVAIGADLAPEPGMPVIDATGRYVMPGIIDTHSHIMISNGLGGVNEATHSIVCEVRVGDVVNTLDPQEYRALAGGVTTARLFHGSANVIGGQDAVVQLRHGDSAAAHLFPNARAGVKFALGENVKFRRGRFPNTRLGVEATLQRAFIEALEYRRDWQAYELALKSAGSENQVPAPRRDLRLQALAEILSQEKFIHSHCYRSDEILMLLRVATHHGIRVWSLQHVLEGYKVAPEIVAHGASCSTFADWWAYKVEAYDATPYNSALLHEAGANVVIKSDNEELMRHLNQEAAKTVRYGSLPPDTALSLVTLNPARELGLADQIGSIEVGKQADFAIFNGHPLNTFARCEVTIIAGQPYFVREQQPTAMTAVGQAVSARPRDITLIPSNQRRGNVDWSPVTGDRFAIINAAIHPVEGPDISTGTILCEAGRITAVGADVAIPADWPVVDVAGLQVYPGLIDAGTTVGITEIGKVVETNDYEEAGLFQPDLQAGVAVNPDSELIPVARAGGITTALIRPRGGVISGQSSFLQMGGWTAPEMVRVGAVGLQIQWPGVHDQRERFEQLQEWLKVARAYDAARTQAADAQGLSHIVDPRYEALRPYVRGELPVFVEAHSRQHLSEVLAFAKTEKLKVVLCGAADAWKLAGEIREAGIPVIVGPVMQSPHSEFDPYDAPYANPGRLHEAGVKFCIRSDNAANSRNAPFEAGMAVAFGLPEEAALRSVTLSAAEILGVAAETGSIRPGKRADLVILDGSPLQVTSQVKGVVVAGQPFAPESRQTRLYEKYRQRLAKPTVMTP